MKTLRQMFKTPGPAPASPSQPASAPTPHPKEPETKPLWKDQPKCAFLQLPGELRNTIYNLVLAHQSSTTSDGYLTLSRLCQPPLTATCRQIQHESLPIFFTSNRFKLTIHITPSWHLANLIDPETARWVKAAGADAKDLREVRFLVNRPGRPGRHAYRVMDLLPLPNPHFNTSWSLSMKKDHSDLPRCPDYFIATHWTSLAKTPSRRESLTFADVVGIGEEVAATWVPVGHRFLMRRFGKERLDKIRAVATKIWPKKWLIDFVDPVCACRECRRERREAKVEEKRRRKSAGMGAGGEGAVVATK